MGVYNFSLSSGMAIGASIATVVTVLGGGYAQSILLCALAPIFSLPLVLMSKPGRRLALTTLPQKRPENGENPDGEGCDSGSVDERSMSSVH